MNDGCIAIHPASREEGMRRGAGMGLNARASVEEVNSVRTTTTTVNRSLQTSSPVSFQLPGSPRHVTDGSDTSCYTNNTTNNPPLQANNSSSKAQRSQMTNGDDDNGPPSNRTVEQQSNPAKRPAPSSEQLEDSEELARATSEHEMTDGQQSAREYSEDQQSALTSTNCSPERESPMSLPQHQQIQEVEPLDISYRWTAASLRVKDLLVERLTFVAPSGRLQVVDLSKRGLEAKDAELIALTLRSNPQLAVLKLGYNNLGNQGTCTLASGISQDGKYHHRCLTILDLGFNSIGDEGCTALALYALAGNHILRTLVLSGNCFHQKGVMSLAGAILHGCSLRCLHVTSNKLGPIGIKVLSGAVAESEARRHQLMQRQGGVITAVQPVALEELNLGDISIKPQGFVALPSMLLSNKSLRSLCLSHNDIDDRDMALFAQAVSQNKQIPLVSLQLSFNQITCVGVECLMNAIWGSKTLKEIKLDNNKIQDRGAQLCSVVLGSVTLEVLDIGFNRVTPVGIKAIMKSLSENDTLRSLSMSGIPVDQNSSKAVSYAMAYNCSLEVFNIDSCCIGYSGQRHIVAGIVSNRNVKLRTMTGFPLGPITKTLGVPQLPDTWGNDRVLSFMRFMWAHWREHGALGENGRHPATDQARGPAPPATVAAAAKKAFTALVETEASKCRFEQEHGQEDASPLINPDAAILERSDRGALQIPSWTASLAVGPESELPDGEAWSSESDSFDRSSFSDSSHSSSTNAVDPDRRNKNLQWLRAHFQSLHEVGNLPFSNADLWQLHQYFFSPVYSATDDGESLSKGDVDDSVGDVGSPTARNASQLVPVDKKGQEQPATIRENGHASSPANAGPRSSTGLGRAISFKVLDEAMGAALAASKASSGVNKRRSVEATVDNGEPCAKRAKSLRPRIAYYPRIRDKLESLGTKPSGQTLALLRQLKYIEGVLLQGKNVYIESDEVGEQNGPNSSDVEMILLDLL